MFSSEPSEKRIEIWTHIWRHSDLMEVRHQALYAYQHRKLARAEVRVILGWIDDCSCWEHSDDLSKIYADVVEANPGWILPTLKRWNRADNPWKRRQSVVALIEYASKRKSFLPFEVMISQVMSLLDDEDYYVQKGLGWTIREIGNAYPAKTSEFMRRHVARLSSQAWTGATRKMDSRTRATLKAIRQRG